MDSRTESVSSSVKRPIVDDDATHGCSMKKANNSKDQVGSLNKMEDQPSMTYEDRLQALIATFYPQFARLKYTPIEIDIDKMLSSSRPSSHTIRYRCKIYIFDMFLESRDLYITFEEAKEAVAKLAYDMLNEFNFIVRSRKTDQRFGRLFQPLIDAMTANLASLHTSEEAFDHHQVLSIERYKEAGSLSLQKDVLSATFSAIYDKMNGIQKKQAPEPVPTVKAVTQKIATVSRTSDSQEAASQNNETLLDPLSALFEHYQKRGGLTTAPEFEIFQGKTPYLFGCRCRYDGKDYIAEGIYKTKKDAKRAVATIVCEAFFGEHAPLLRVEGSQKASGSKDIVFAKSIDIAGTKIVASSQGTCTSDQTEPIEPAQEKVNVEPPAGKKFVSIINEACQINKLPQPDYLCKTGDTISSYFIMYAHNLFDRATLQKLGLNAPEGFEPPKRFVSAPFTKKSDAKEDCAGRFFIYLRDLGVFDDNCSLLVRPSQPTQQQRYSHNQRRTQSNTNAALPNWGNGPPPPFPFPFSPPHPGALRQLPRMPPLPMVPPMPMMPQMLIGSPPAFFPPFPPVFPGIPKQQSPHTQSQQSQPQPPNDPRRK